MTQDEIDEIEGSLSLRLPAGYRGTLLSYPFLAGSFADEFLLLNRAKDLLALNPTRLAISGIEKPFVIGSDGGEESYFLDAANAEPGVFVFDLETGNHRLLARSLPAYVDYIRTILDEIAADEEDEKRRSTSRRWWEFWK